MSEIQKVESVTDGTTIYNNPAAIHPHEKGRLFYAVAPEGCGSYGSTPEEARELLEVVCQEYAGGTKDEQVALRDLAAERVAEISEAGGRKVIDADG